MYRPILLFAVLIVACPWAVAQPRCGSEVMHRAKMDDPTYQLKYNTTNSVTRNAIVNRRSARTQSGNPIYTIPVVFHIMHKGEPLGSGVNFSNEQIFAAMKELNERFRKIPGSIGDGNSVDTQIQFALAVRDPNGNCTNGINRIDMTGYPDYMDYGMNDPGMDEAAVKSLSFWDSHYYANVWLVSQAYNYGGFSYYADSHGTSYDGIVATPGILIDPGYPGLTHEFGHYFNLLHTFEGWNGACPPNDNCLFEGDLVCDTPPQAEGASCELTPNECVPGESFAAVNYMSYSCLTEFTEGQKERVVIAASLIRSSLLAENGNMALVPVGMAAPDFTLASEGLCITAGSRIRIVDHTSCIANTFIGSLENGTSFNWTMAGDNGITLTSTDQNPVFTIPADGRYDVTLSITSSSGTNSVTKADFIVAGGVLPPASSCIPLATGASMYRSRTDDIGIREVVLNDLHHISGSSVQDVTTSVTGLNGYGDFSCTEMASLEPFTEYTIRVVLSEFSAEHVHVYIDFDNDGITDNDLVTFAYYIPAGSGTYSLPSFTTPPFPIFNTRLRMRVVDADGSEDSPAACGVVGYLGQIHDYSIIFNNEIPIANNDEAIVNEDNVAVVSVAGNDSDHDGTLLSPVDLDPVAPFFQNEVTTTEGVWKAASGNRVSFEPKPDFNGVATIQYTILDNRFTESLPATITVTVIPVNDAPSFTKGTDEIIVENEGAQTVPAWATDVAPGPMNESSQLLTFDVTNDNDALFIEQPALNTRGDLTFTLAPNAFGPATVRVVLYDDGGTANGGVDASAIETFRITINAQIVTGADSNPSAILVYPNPSTAEFRVRTPPSWLGSAVKIIDVLGKVIHESTIENDDPVNLSQHPRGMYLLRVEGSAGTFMTRIVLK